MRFWFTFDGASVRDRSIKDAVFEGDDLFSPETKLDPAHGYDPRIRRVEEALGGSDIESTSAGEIGLRYR